MAGAGKKTFTAGETLTASDVNTYLMEQSVMVFGGTAARASAIPTPSTGMTSYIGVTGTATIPQIETYTGSTWQTPYGVTQVANVSVSAAADVTIDNCFTSTYTNYLVMFVLTGAATSPGYFRYRAAGATLTDAIYSVNMGMQTSVPTPAGGSRSDSFAQVFPVFATNPSVAAITFLNPAISGRTSYTGLASGGAGATDQFQTIVGGGNRVNTLVDGFVFTPAGATTLTGTVRVYGYRNS
jgi:hypothetical protein